MVPLHSYYPLLPFNSFLLPLCPLPSLQMQGRKKLYFVGSCVFVWVGAPQSRGGRGEEGGHDAKQISTEWELLSWWEMGEVQGWYHCQWALHRLPAPSPVGGYFGLQRKGAEPDRASRARAKAWEPEPPSGTKSRDVPNDPFNLHFLWCG